MRANPTAGERALQALLRPLDGWEFQKPILVPKARSASGEWPYIADAFCAAAKLIVEVDGGVHKRTKGRDRRRDERAKTMLGLLTLRLSNTDVLKNPDWALRTIEALVKQRCS